MALTERQLLIAGKFQPARDGRLLDSVDPTSGEAWSRIADATAADVDDAVCAALAAFATPLWAGRSPTRRGRLLMRLADLVAEHADRLAELEVRENGKLMREMTTQMRVVPDWLYYYGGLADKAEGRTIPLDRTSVFNYTLREPLGVVGVITPWNSPIFLTVMAMAPALAAGNTVVLKPSESASAGVLELGRLASEAGFPDGVVNVVTGAREAGEALVRHPCVAKIAFTGSTSAGRAIAAAVGTRLARATLELGGKSANIVFADSDLDRATAGVLAGIFAAGGQTCVAGSRVLAQRPIHDELVRRLRERAQAIVIGDPMRSDTQMGPIATARQLSKIREMVERARADGATVVTGGGDASVHAFPNGFFYQPTIVVDVPPGAEIGREEVFGPVLVAYPFDSDDDALAIANDSEYGLAAGLWTRDINRAHRLAGRLAAGTVWVNTYRAMAFNSPFGGYKASGFGRVNGAEAIDEFLQTKSVWIETSEDVQDPFTLKA